MRPDFPMPPLRFKIIEAFGFLCQETCIILYWMGLWSLLQNFTPLLNSVAFNLFCLLFGAAGVFTVKAIAPALILASVEESTHRMYKTIPVDRQNVRYLVRQGANFVR